MGQSKWLIHSKEAGKKPPKQNKKAEKDNKQKNAHTQRCRADVVVVHPSLGKRSFAILLPVLAFLTVPLKRRLGRAFKEGGGGGEGERGEGKSNNERPWK